MSNTDTLEKIQTEIKVEPPKMYKVLLHNDDTTSMEFVVMVLMSIYHHTPESAVQLMMHIHENGEAIAGSPYTREIAEEKVAETTKVARANGYPLTSTVEEL